MIHYQMKAVFHHKVGTHANTDKIVYKFYFGSVDPHFYFSAYVIPSKNSFKMYYIPQVNNIDNFNVVPMFDSAYSASADHLYGENIEIVLSNPELVGVGRMVYVDITIDSVPCIFNSDSNVALDMDVIHRALVAERESIVSIGMYTLSNMIAVQVESKINSILALTTGVSQENIVMSVASQILFSRGTIKANIPTTISAQENEILSQLLLKAVNTSPYSNVAGVMFADFILFTRMLDLKRIPILNIPYEVLFNLALEWMKTKGYEYEDKLLTASNKVVKTISIDINTLTMSNSESVYALLGGTQEFVYIKSISVGNIESGDVIEMDTNNLYANHLSKQSDRCEEKRGFEHLGKRIILQYGYGTSCSSFAGFQLISGEAKYGIIMEEKIVDDQFTSVRKWTWGPESLEVYGSTRDISHNIRLTITGV